jgi:DNA-binding NarL/FixJ family response regulator
MAAFILVQFLLLLALVIGAGAAGIALHRRIGYLDGDIRGVNLASIAESQDLRRQIEDLAARLDSMEAKLAGFQQRQLASVNYTQRSQAIRLIRRGETAESIARTLGVPRSQISLLMKLQAGHRRESAIAEPV